MNLFPFRLVRGAFFLGTVITSGVGPGTRAEVPAPLVSQVGIEGDHFSLDGKPLQIISGELHYARIPREYWRDRLQKARALGLNTVSTYVFWNLHEPKPGVYDFRGNLDAALFIRTAQEEGLFVILRPGPYVCAEWDLGGLPSWLFADPNMVLRSGDETFLGPTRRWLQRLGREGAPLHVDQGACVGTLLESWAAADSVCARFVAAKTDQPCRCLYRGPAKESAHSRIASAGVG